MLQYFSVAAGGALGAVCRYICGFIPLGAHTTFPFKTLCINLFGSFFIGLIVSRAVKSGHTDSQMVLFLKTGFCGGFTTFSTFSLESFTLLQAGNIGQALLYMALSVVLCIGGTAAGFALGRHIP